MVSQTYYDRNAGELSEEQLDEMSRRVRGDPQIYGLLVSPDLRSALIRAQLTESGLDYAKTFEALQQVREEESVPGVTIHATGQPVLIGWTYHYLPEIFRIFVLTLAIMVGLLVYYFRRWYGILLPLISTLVSGIWGLGFLGMRGYNIDPPDPP